VIAYDKAGHCIPSLMAAGCLDTRLAKKINQGIALLAD